jgi:hypothetical protein
MQYLATSKVSKLKPKPNTIYPLIRLPQECFGAIGKTVDIYKTDFEFLFQLKEQKLKIENT